MKLTNLVLAAALAIGMGGAVSAAPLASAPEQIAQQPDTLVAYAKGRGHGWKGGRGHHYGWSRGHHRGWARPHYRRAFYAPARRHYGWHRPYHRRVYYAPMRRHYGWYRGRHYGWHRPYYRSYGYHRRPVAAVYFGF
jgi:hypothetical protein